MGMYICLASHWHRLKRAVTPIDGAGLFVALGISTRCRSAAGKPTVLDQARDPAVLHMSLSDPRSVCSRSDRLGPTVSGGDSVHQLSALGHCDNVRASPIFVGGRAVLVVIFLPQITSSVMLAADEAELDQYSNQLRARQGCVPRF